MSPEWLALSVNRGKTDEKVAKKLKVHTARVGMASGRMTDDAPLRLCGKK